MFALPPAISPFPARALPPSHLPATSRAVVNAATAGPNGRASHTHTRGPRRRAVPRARRPELLLCVNRCGSSHRAAKVAWDTFGAAVVLAPRACAVRGQSGSAVTERAEPQRELGERETERGCSRLRAGGKSSNSGRAIVHASSARSVLRYVVCGVRREGVGCVREVRVYQGPTRLCEKKRALGEGRGGRRSTLLRDTRPPAGFKVSRQIQ